MQSRHLSIVFAVSAVVAFATPARAERPSAASGAAKPKPDGPGKPTSPAAPAGGPKDDGPKRPPKKEAESEMSPETALARATAFYEAGQYAQCADSLAEILDDPDRVRALSPRSRDQAAVYDAACLIAIGNTDAANDRFRVAIRENPQMAVPSAVVFPPAVIERFVVVRSELLEEIRRSEQERVLRERTAAEEARKHADAERRRVAMLEQLAAHETIVSRNHRWIASVPFGVGQFQNRDVVLGSVFLASETLLLATALTANALELHYNSQANGGAGFNSQTPFDTLNQDIQTAHIVTLSATAGLLLVAGGGILQAHLAFVPEFRDGTRPRKIPKGADLGRALAIQPTIAPTGGGAAFGLFGRF